MGIETGANCRNFGYELLWHFGRHVPNLRSSNLWDDTEYPIVADEYEPLDLLLFNRTRNAWGAHVSTLAMIKRSIYVAGSDSLLCGRLPNSSRIPSTVYSSGQNEP